MEVRVWQSFSCNNSGSYYLVARFDSATDAETSATEIRNFLETHAKQKDSLIDEDDGDWEDPSVIQNETAEKYGFSWEDEMVHWGDDALEGDEPIVSSSGDKLVVYHSYCGGLDFLDPYVKALGGKDVVSEDGEPALSVMLTFAGDEKGTGARDSLDAFFGQGITQKELDEWDTSLFGGGRMPYGSPDEVTYWSTANHAGFHFDLDASILPGLRKFLDGAGVTDYQMRINDRSIPEKLEILSATKRCPECRSRKIEYVPATDSVHADQVSCDACGGMFDLPTLKLLSRVQRVDNQKLNRIARTATGMVCIGFNGDCFVEGDDGWKEIENGLGSLRGLHARAMGDLWICGSYGNLRSSRDGGKTWKQHKLETNACLYSICEEGATLYVSGDKGALLRSKNGGGSFEELGISGAGDVLHISARSSRLVYSGRDEGLLCACTRAGEIAISINHAKSWKLEKVTDKALCRIAEGTDGTIVCVGDGGVVIANDGSGFKTIELGLAGDLEDLVVTAEHGFVAIESNGAALTSADGTSWTVYKDAIPTGMWGLAENSDGQLIAVGAGGVIARLDLADD